MSISYDAFIGAFLSKITEFDFYHMEEENREAMVEGYLRRAVSQFQQNCKYDLVGSMNEDSRSFDVDVPDKDFDELVDIISEGMLVQWLKPYVYRQENLENVLNTADFTTYSPAELLYRVGNAYKKAQEDYTQMIREYSFAHGNLGNLHL